MGVFKKGKDWWIDYYVSGRRKREKIGPNKRLAETVLQKRKVEIAEGKFLDKRKQVSITFKDLAKWYKQKYSLRKKSYLSELSRLKTFVSYFGVTRLNEITTSMVEDYQTARKAALKPATVNKETAILRHMFNKAIQEGFTDGNPVGRISPLQAKNVRDRVLTHEEFGSLMDAAAPSLRPILQMAYYTGMRRGEILNLKRDRVDFKNSVIRLRHEDTKTDDGRVIPLNPVLKEALRGTVTRLGSEYVFCKPDGMPHVDIRKQFYNACIKAGVENFVFHDFRHTCITNWRRAGVDILTILRLSGHKTTSVFKRYNTIDEKDLLAAMSKVDTYMDTTASNRDVESNVSH